eukprot:3345433-Rhodomonas_salina.2
MANLMNGGQADATLAPWQRGRLTSAVLRYRLTVPPAIMPTPHHNEPITASALHKEVRAHRRGVAQCQSFVHPNAHPLSHNTNTGDDKNRVAALPRGKVQRCPAKACKKRQSPHFLLKTH